MCRESIRNIEEDTVEEGSYIRLPAPVSVNDHLPVTISRVHQAEPNTDGRC